VAQNPRYEFIGKTLFFPEEGILVVGDLHIGYEYMLRQSGILVPERQIKDMIAELNEIFKKIKKEKHKLNKIVFLGDIKHAFGFQFQERNEFREIMDFLKQHVSEKNIILIKGNHDTMDYSYGNMKEFHIEGDLAFLHGHKPYPEIFDKTKKVKVVVIGHLHPSIILTEKPGVKREAYKCFLSGSWKGKTFIVVPSFLGFVEGTPVNNYREDYMGSFSVIPRAEILKFKIHVLGNDGVYDFGKVGDLG
jgi:putative SbcD/Mre11-related phosphoesterase